MTDASQVVIVYNATMQVPTTALSMFTPDNVSMGVWGDVYGGLTWPVLGRMEDFNQTVGDIATDAWFHLRHEP